MPEPAESRLSEDTLPEPIRRALQDYARHPENADLLFQVACAQADNPLPLYRLLYKFYNRQRRFDLARDYARRALAEAARRGGLTSAPETWRASDLLGLDSTNASQLRLALKAQAFLALRAGDHAASKRPLDILLRLDPEDGSGASVVSALADSLA